MPARTLPPLNAVRAFEAAARRASFTEAAQELGVTHGAISRQVRLLEDWLGSPALFRRGNRGVALTESGTMLLTEVGPALDRIAVAAARHRGRKGSRGSTLLRVNALATFSLRWLLPRLSRFRDEHPAIEVRLTTGNEAIDSLAEEYDLVIRGGPDSFHGFAARELLQERRLPVCSPDLANRIRLRRVADLQNHTMLHVTSMPRLWRDWLSLAGHPTLSPAADLTLDHFYLSVQAALDGLGVAMGPTTLITDDLSAGRLIAPFPDLSLPARSYFAYLPEHRVREPACTAFCDWIERTGRH